MKNQPIKRSEALKILSREHHFALLFTWKIKQGLRLKVAPTRLLHYVNYFWEGQLQPHFLSEETLLFNRVDAEVCTQAKMDHQIISSQIQALNLTNRYDGEAFQALIDVLNAHIRFEERVVFPYLEKVLAASLSQVLLALTAAHAEGFKDEYPDEFWKPAT